MPPKRTHPSTQAVATDPAGVKKSKKVPASSKTSLIRTARPFDTSFLDHTPSRRTIRSLTNSPKGQLTPSSSTSTARLPPPKSVQPTSTAASSPTQLPQSTQRKRKHESEEELSDRRQREGSQCVVKLPPSKDLLNRKNLEKLNNETLSERSDGMAEKKRTLSRQSSISEMSQGIASVSSQKTSLSLANYRLNSLDKARIVFQHRGIPEHLEHRVSAIIQPELDEEKETLVFSVADDLSNGFPKVLEVACREDDNVELIYQAMETMNRKLFGEAFAFRRKAEWDPALKPTVQRKSYRLAPLDKSLDDTGDSHDQLNKRQQAGTFNFTLRSSEMAMPPPPLPPKPNDHCVKNARPDITIGFFHAVVAKKLVSLGVNKIDAEEMLKDLQDKKELFSSPTLPELHTRFPSIVVEGKSYATGKSMYEAENQAAGSGSCMLVMQGRLVELTERCSPETHESKDPIAFSITHEGPILLLWLHYITSLENARFYNLHVLKICHATIPSTTRDFFKAIAGVMNWASTEFLDDIAAQLFSIWNATQGHVE